MRRLKRIHKTLLITSSVVLGFIAVTVFRLMTAGAPVERLAQTDAEQLQQLPQPIAFNSRLLIGGDIFLGRSVERASLASESGYAYPFGRIDSLGLADYQAVIANLECPSTDTAVPFTDQVNYLKFNCLPAFLPELAKHFDIVSLANNHTDNVDGLQGFAETRVHLADNGLQYFGHYDSAVTDELCEVVAVQAKLLYDNGLVEDTSIPIALCGYHGVFAIPTDEQLAVISDYSRWLPTIVLPHMGAEYQPSADTIRRNVYRQMVDNGADLVAGGHPHWVQNSEAYKGKLIVYSMGNLIFDQQFDQEVQRSLLIDLTIEIPFDDNARAWVAMAESCRAFQDDCLDEAAAQNLDKLEAEFAYSLQASQLKDMVVRRAGEAVRNAVLTRADWSAVRKALAN